MPNAPATPVSWNEESVRNFHLEQLKILRAKADKLNEETRATERYVLLAVGAIYTFVFAQANALHGLPSAKFIWWIPPALVFLGGLRSWALRDYILGCDSYVKIAECALRVEGIAGWEHWWKDDAAAKNRHHTIGVAVVVWAATLVGTIAIALVVAFGG